MKKRQPRKPPKKPLKKAPKQAKAKAKAASPQPSQPEPGEIPPVLLDRIKSLGPPTSPQFADLSVELAKLESRKVRFLRAFTACAGNMSRAAIAAGVHRTTHWTWLEDKAYKRAFAKAERQAAQVLEDEAIRRAFEGTLKGIYHKGILVDFELVYSDCLMLQLLRARHTAHRNQNVSTFKGAGRDGSIPVSFVVEDPKFSGIPEEELLQAYKIAQDALQHVNNLIERAKAAAEPEPEPA
jgi:hypothetical protein